MNEWYAKDTSNSFACAAGIKTFSSVSNSAIALGLLPSLASKKIRFTTVAVQFPMDITD